MPGNQLCQMVYEQWLDSDLSEIATPCLPPGIKDAKKIKLNGNFALQVKSKEKFTPRPFLTLCLPRTNHPCATLFCGTLELGRHLVVICSTRCIFLPVNRMENSKQAN